MKSLSRRVSKKHLLENVTFDLQDGERLAILGPSGSGKSTLLRLIVGLEAPSEGTITWRKQVLSRAEEICVLPERRKIGMVFQDSALFPHLNVRENVAFGVAHLSSAEKISRVDEWLDRVEMKGFSARKIQYLSGGEKQRVALARALAPNPELLLLDEPLSSVDRLVRHDLIKKLRDSFAAVKKTVIFVTHDARDAIELGADRLLLLDQGKMIRLGATQEVISSPGNAWAEHFLACSLGSGNLGSHHGSMDGGRSSL
jgi:ABC-type sulfate/molybdate transport systems ATPase subunit